MRTLGLSLLCLIPSGVLAEEYVGVFWNLESGESQASAIAAQMADKGAVEFWGLTNVADQTFLDTLEQAVEAETGADYTAKLSEQGGADRPAVLFNSAHLQMSGTFEI
jgi:hypothetical protein